MNMQDRHNNILPEVSIYPQVINTTLEAPAGCDLAGFREAEVLFEVGAAGDVWSSSVKVKLEVWECDSLSGTYTKAADTDLLGAPAEWTSKTDHEKLSWSIGYIGKKQFIKAYVKLTGTHTTGTIFGATIIKGNASHNPVQ